jgi:putative YphP/YqiW family bacilliredoxin
MMYDERFLTAMREELTRYGIEELRTSAAVDEKLKDAPGTTLVVVNSVCGCAARNARPAVATALESAAKKPDHLYTVLRAELAVDRSVQGRQVRFHARATPDRRAFGVRDFGRPRRRIREVRLGRDGERVRSFVAHPAQPTKDRRRVSSPGRSTALMFSREQRKKKYPRASEALLDPTVKQRLGCTRILL